MCVHTCRYRHRGILIGIQQSLIALVAIMNILVLLFQLFPLVPEALPCRPTLLLHIDRERCLSSSFLGVRTLLLLPSTLGMEVCVCGDKTLGLLCFISEFCSSWRAASFICHTHFHGQLQSQLPLEIRL